jgi:tyrosinase
MRIANIWKVADVSRLAPHGKYYEWITNISVQKHCLGGPFGVHIFLGDVPTDPLSWLTHKNNVGEFFVLASDTAHSGCDKCKKDEEAKVQVRGIVPLTSTLTGFVVQGSLGSLEPADVVPYLIKHMHWRVAFVSTLSSLIEKISQCTPIHYY